ncbi:MAG: hypothetical protein K6D97_00285 [Clostridia bacterium]|nr:hypothetical protein [Clostridia bacterium]
MRRQRSRFDGTEETNLERAAKLSGTKNSVAQSVLHKMLLWADGLEYIYLSKIDQLGLYGDRIEMLFVACERDLDLFMNTVDSLYDKFSNQMISQDQIIKMKTQEDFDKLVNG